MAKQSNGKEKENDARRRRRFWNCAQLVVGAWIKNSLGFYFDENFEPADIDGPVLVVINHASAYDPIFVGKAFKNKPLTFIASEHILRGKWGPFLEKNISFIPHSKGAKGSRTALVAMKRMKKGESVFLAAEGEQTWNGRPLPVMPYTGKLVKGSGATLVTYMLEGAYLSAPRWALNTRKGKVFGHPVNVYTPEMLKGMSDEEVEGAIAKDLAFDIWEWQKAQPGGPVSFKSSGGNAEGLERDVFTCPACGAFGTLRSQGDEVRCKCRFRIRMSDTGFFVPDVPFETVADWEEYDRQSLQKALADKSPEEEKTIFSDKNIVLRQIENDHNDKEIASGKITLSKRGGKHILSIGDYSFDIMNISSMTMVLATRVVFSDKSGYYELKSEKGSKTNLRKYVIAREIIKE